ncbi:MAG TPA: hypothetical protein VHL78_00480, partial [Actinomycetota bacterium]|nr:hypothetical protein [Actinomycetota bacterium]
MPRLPRSACAVGAALLLSACRSSAPSTLEPQGPVAERVADVWWLMLAISSVVVAVVGALLLVAIVRRRRAADPSGGSREPR